jgi:hypothetical protein
MANTWYELKVCFQAEPEIVPGQIQTTDLAWALLKEMEKTGVKVAFVSNVNLEPMSLRKIQ